jgi:hypothetical protein
MYINCPEFENKKMLPIDEPNIEYIRYGTVQQLNEKIKQYLSLYQVIRCLQYPYISKVKSWNRAEPNGKVGYRQAPNKLY